MQNQSLISKQILAMQCFCKSHLMLRYLDSQKWYESSSTATSICLFEPCLAFFTSLLEKVCASPRKDTDISNDLGLDQKVLDPIHFKALVNFGKGISFQPLKLPEDGTLVQIFCSTQSETSLLELPFMPCVFNSNLVAAYEKAKKKHQNKLKKLESQMMAMVERHETQVRMLKQRIALLEEENSRPHTNETSL